MDRFAFALALLVWVIPATAQQRPDPRLELTLNTTVIKEMQRSVDFSKTIPPPAVRPRPAVNEPYMAKMDDAIYVDRRLLPQRVESDDSEVVRVRRSDR